MLTPRTDTPRLLSDEQTSLTTSISLLTTADLKDYLEITHSEDDTQIDAHLATARDYFDRISGHRLDRQERQALFDRASRIYELPSKPFVSLDAVESLDEGTATSEGTSNFYVYGTDAPEVKVKRAFAWSAPLDAVRFTYTAGYTSASDVPAGVAEVLKKMVSDLYEFRTSVHQEGNVPRELVMTWKELLTPYSVPKF